MKTTRLLLSALFAVLLASCAQPPVPQDHFYRMEAPMPAGSLAKTPLAGTLEVARLQADGLTAGRPIVYSDAANPLEANEYHYHFWTDTPTVMLRDELVSYLRNAGAAKTVITPEMRLEPDFVLTGRIKRMEQIRGTVPKVLISLELALRDRREDRLVLVKTYRMEGETPGPGVAAAVGAMNAGAAEIFARFVADLAAL
ncbi:MAG: membrane integrity-associated transporter subunit PqiC [Rhodospirillales bacterium]|nr:membrane integrity-associated transporter subunit PqiC [Rhodospirillales bacterium]